MAKYNFNDGTTNDELGKHHAKANNATLINDRFGNSASAYYLHGNLGSYLNLGTSDAIKPKRGTISLWIKIDHLMLNGKGVEINPIMVTRAHSGEDHVEAIFIGYDINTKNLNVNTTVAQDKQVSIYASEPTSLREWHHLAITFDRAFLSFYVDGALQEKMPRNFDSQYLKGDSIMVGNWVSKKNVRFFNGGIDDIAIYNRVLSSKEINDLYNEPDPNHWRIIFKWALVALALLGFIALIVFIVKRRIRFLLKKESERNLLVNKALEQEIRILKAQMDPHFIFNSLNTILQFIIVNENKKAELYLTKFAKLVRKLLESNTNESISLEDEIDLIDKYLEIESIRFDKKIKTIIEVDATIDPSAIFIPHMLVQPFIENAIWHGFRLKEGELILKVLFEWKNQKCIRCIIDDNGTGRNEETSDNPLEKNKSLAINFIRQRLDLLSKINNCEYGLTIIDKKDAEGKSEGTRVEICLPLIKK